MTAAEKTVEEIVTLLEPLEPEVVSAIEDVIKALLSHPEGAELVAKRTAEALAAEAAIRS